MVNPVQPVGKRSVEPTRIEPAADRSSLASSAVTGPAAPPALAAPATNVQLSDAVIARQRGVVPGRARTEGRGDRWLASADAARAEADAASRAVRADAAHAIAVQANMPAARVYGLLLD
jgi:hypothetical protein